MNLNKGISTPIAILLIVAVSAIAGVLVWQFTKPAEQPAPKQASDYTTQPACEEANYYWYKDSCHKEKQPETANWRDPVEKVVRKYGKALKTRKRDKVIPYTTGDLQEEYERKPSVFGMSNPHPDGCKVLSSEKVNDNKFKVKARCFDAYTGQGRIGYRDNSYIVKKIEDDYLISSIESGEYVSIGGEDENNKEGIEVGEIEIDDAEAAELQEAVDSGQQPWRSDPLMVAEAEAAQYGFDESDSFTLERTMASAGVAKVEAIHNGESYTITLIQSTQGDGKIWMMQKIEKE